MKENRRNLTFTVIALFSLIIVSGCIKPLQDLVTLREKVVEEYQQSNVNITIQNGNAIGVSFINSSFNELEQAKKEAKAKEIALFVKQNYPSMDNIDMIWVSFTIHKTYFFVFNYTNSLDTFFYKTDELESTSP